VWQDHDARRGTADIRDITLQTHRNPGLEIP
jgi:hypothetical protein